MFYSDHLREEHEWIGLAHQLINGYFSQQDVDLTVLSDDLVFLVEFLEEFGIGLHFKKEEEILFPEIRKMSLDKQGGPRCGDFVGRIQMWDYSEEILKLANEKIKAQYEMAPSLKELLGEKLGGLSVPLDEHEACYMAVELLKDYYAGGGEVSKADILKLVRLLLDLLADHREKEDTCLLVIFEKMATNELQEDMCKRALKLNEEFGLDRIKKYQTGLIEMARRYNITHNLL